MPGNVSEVAFIQLKGCIRGFPRDPSLKKRGQGPRSCCSACDSGTEEGHTVVMPTIGDLVTASTGFRRSTAMSRRLNDILGPGLLFTAAAAVGGLPLLLQQERMAVVPSIQSREDRERL